ncbi:CHASE domain-containing protein [Alkalimarinus coralli]|uniref:CHASE domain-containing protein n=1 Tax=Alkalimarinus coralli TaxID=2935863 RepID=UPI00202AC32A|nr:CHASE domain-containing protein [Alkalimarinus coralli]
METHQPIKNVPPLFKTLIVALAYWVAGVAGSFFSIPPGFASAVWPAAGIALASAFLLGVTPAVTGTYIGSFCVNTLNIIFSGQELSLNSLILPLIMASGAAIQLLVGYLILNRFISFPLRFINQQETLTFLIIAGPVTCLISATLAVVAFITTDTVPISKIPFTWFTWWVGDTIGTLFFAPLTIIAFSSQKLFNNSRRFQVVLPSLIIFIIVSAFFEGSRDDQHKRQQQELEDKASQFTQTIDKQALLIRNKLLALTAIYRGSKFVDRQEFTTFSKILLENDDSIQALEWVPIIHADERVNYEYLARSEGYPHFEFTELSPSGELTKAASREYYCPVYYVEPYEGNEKALGFDVCSNSGRKSVLNQARDTGKQVASPPINLVQEVMHHPGFIVVSPLYEHSGFGVPATLKDRRDRVSGYVLGVYSTEKVVKQALEFAQSNHIELTIIDITETDNPINILTTISDSSNHLSNVFDVKVADRVWQVSFYPNKLYYLLAKDWTSWSVLTGGIVLAILLQAFILLITGFNEAKQDEIERKTRALDKARKEAEDANQAKSDFLANMSHEFRTPLNAIIGLNDIILKTELTSRQRDYLSKAKSASHTLLNLINDTLDYSKIEAGQMELENTIFDLNELLTKIETLFQHTAHDKNIRFKVSGPQDFSTRLIGDPLRLEQVLLNLCSNALKFTERGSVSVTVSTRQITETSVSLLFSISDTGIGISAEHQKHLFSSFKQADTSTTRKYGGTGLGLTISKRLIELMGGSITLQSKEGEGSTFSFAVSFRPSTDVIDRQPEHSLAPENDDAPMAGLRILVVEDNLVNQLIAEEVLKSYGAEVVLADNGRIGLEKLQSDGDFSAILMDIQMPEMDGYEATERIRANPSFEHIPIIAMTANALNSDRVRCIEAGMNDHLPKPFEPEDVANAIIKWTRKPPVT